jgi:hypothetical protein
VEDPRSKPTAAALLVCALGSLLGGAVIVVGVREYRDAQRLDRAGVRVVADVVGTRIMQSGSRQSFEIQYSFTAPGRAGTFGLSDSLGRSNLWTATDGEPEWNHAQQTGQVDVLYLPDDPSINRLVTHHGTPLADNAAAILLGLMLAGTSLYVGGLEVTGRGPRWRRVVDRIRERMLPGR